MSIDVVDLRNFYGQRLGVVAAASSVAASAACGRIPRSAHARHRLCHAYLGLFREEAERCLAFMPAGQGVVKWPSTRPALSALVDENELPLPDNAVDRVLLVHGLEMTTTGHAVARSVAGAGRRWPAAGGGAEPARPVGTHDTTPFGHGRPYSRSQINQLLRETWFTPTGWSEALYMPPVARGWFLRSRWPGAHRRDAVAPFAGVHLVEATKQVYRAIPRAAKSGGWFPRSSRCWRRHPAGE